MVRSIVNNYYPYSDLNNRKDNDLRSTRIRTIEFGNNLQGKNCTFGYGYLAITSGNAITGVRPDMYVMLVQINGFETLRVSKRLKGTVFAKKLHYQLLAGNEKFAIHWVDHNMMFPDI